MKIDTQYKVREMAGEHVIVKPGRYGADMTQIIALNPSSLLLWKELADREFEVEDAAQLLVETYGIDLETAQRDAQHWVEQMQQQKLLIGATPDQPEEAENPTNGREESSQQPEEKKGGFWSKWLKR